MLTSTIRLLTFMSCLGCLASVQAEESAGAPKRNEELRQELLRMRQADQDARFKLLDVIKARNLSLEKVKEQPDFPEAKAVADLDRKHTERMKAIIAQHGWPGQSLAGPDGDAAAWLLVQHADHDRAFQQQCLPLLEAAVKKGDSARPNLALLTDRVLTGEGKKQRYGSQCRIENGKAVPFPIEDEANVDKRRAELGLPPLAEYLKQVESLYAPKATEKK